MLSIDLVVVITSRRWRGHFWNLVLKTWRTDFANTMCRRKCSGLKSLRKVHYENHLDRHLVERKYLWRQSSIKICDRSDVQMIVPRRQWSVYVQLTCSSHIFQLIGVRQNTQGRGWFHPEIMPPPCHIIAIGGVSERKRKLTTSSGEVISTIVFA